MPADTDLYDQLLAMGFSKREIDQQLHHVGMWYIREGTKEELLKSTAYRQPSTDEGSTVHRTPSTADRPQSTEKEQCVTHNRKPVFGNLQHKTSDLQPTSIFNRIRHALHLIQTRFAKKPKNPV